MEKNISAPMLFPYEPEEYWLQVRAIIRDEISKIEKEAKSSSGFETSGLTYKPLYKITEVCNIFKVTRPTIYDWIKHGKLKPYKVRSRLYFLWNDIQAMLKN